MSRSLFKEKFGTKQGPLWAYPCHFPSRNTQHNSGLGYSEAVVTGRSTVQSQSKQLR